MKAVKRLVGRVIHRYFYCIIHEKGVVMIKLKNSKSCKKFNKNKKGFSLVELLCAVAIIAIMTPVLVEAFTLAARLNLRSNAQQRVDAAANSVYEGLSSVRYEELKHYLADYNGWTALNKDGTNYDYYVEKNYDGLEDCKVKVSVEKYSDSYLVPNLNLVGVASDYLTLSNELNDYDSIVGIRMEQAIKTDSGVINAIKNEIVSELNSRISDASKKVSNSDINLIIDCGTIDESKITKEIKIHLTNKIEGEKSIVSAEYSLDYRYVGQNINYSYTYFDKVNSKWSGESNKVYTLSNFLLNLILPTSISVEYQDYVGDYSLFMYYTPLSSEDKITITGDHGANYNVYFIKQSDEDFGKENFVGATKIEPNNFIGIGNNIKIYANIDEISEGGIPDSVYEDSTKMVDMYRLKVEVVYQSKYFSDVTGDFAVGDEILQTTSK